MANFSHFELQKALYATLSGDASLTSLVSGVFDHVPPATAFPYVTIGEMRGRDWSSKTTTGMEFLVSIHAFSREGGRKQAADILARIHTLLHDAAPSLTGGHTLVMLRAVESNIALQSDGLTYEATLRLRALVA